MNYVIMTSIQTVLTKPSIKCGWKKELLASDNKMIKASRHNDAFKLWFLMKGKGLKQLEIQVDSLMKLSR